MPKCFELDYELGEVDEGDRMQHMHDQLQIAEETYAPDDDADDEELAAQAAEHPGNERPTLDAKTE